MSDAAPADEEPTCATCGEPVAGRETRRVRTWIEDGSVEYRHFCSDACRDEYVA